MGWLIDRGNFLTASTLPTAGPDPAAFAATPPAVDPAQVRALRAFNRFYTRRIGVLDPYLGSTFSLTEVRLLYELAHHGATTASELARRLSLDAGYLSRIVGRFAGQGWIERAPSPTDARQQVLTLTEAGRVAFEPLQQRSREEAAALLAPLPPPARTGLIDALQLAQRLLEDPWPGGSEAAAAESVITLRAPRAGDMGWVVEQHGALYAQEYGWNSEFEALVAEIVAGMIRAHDPAWEAGWIAKRATSNGPERLGSAFVVRKAEGVAQLRLVLVVPAARGLGLGARLTDACLAFAREKGYRRMVLWTNANLLAARALYARRGFRRVSAEPYHGYGHDLVSETWELDL